MAVESGRSRRRRSQPSDNGSDGNELQELHASAGAPRERVQQLEAQLRQAGGLASKTRIDKNQRNSGSLLHQLAEPLWHLLDRSSLFWNSGVVRPVPHRPPLPPRLCMVCGEVAFSAMSVFCTKCGAPLKL
jgi:hypothetical protein